MECLYQTPPLKAQEPMQKKKKQKAGSVRARGHEWFQGKNIIQTQQDWRTYELMETVRTCIRPAQIQTRQIPAQRRESRQKVPPLNKSYLQLMTAENRKITFLQWSIPGYFNYTISVRSNDQRLTKMDYMVSGTHFCFGIFVFRSFVRLLRWRGKRNRTWSWVTRRISELAGGAENKFQYCVRRIFNKKRICPCTSLTYH